MLKKQLLFLNRYWKRPIIDTPKQQSKYKKLFMALKNNQHQKAKSLLNQFQQLIDLSDPNQYLKFLHNKMLIEFKFREYGQVEMTLKNVFLFCELLKSPNDFLIETHIRLCKLYLYYMPTKLEEAIKNMKNQLRNDTSQLIKLQCLYIQGINYFLKDNLQKCCQNLIKIINQQSNDKTAQIFRQIALIQLLKIKLLKKKELSKPISMQFTKNIIKKYILNKPITLQQFSQISELKLLEHYFSYLTSEQVTSTTIPSKFFKSYYTQLYLILAQQQIMMEKYTEASEFLKYINPHNIHLNFLQAVKFFDRRKFKECQELIDKKIMNTFDQPKYDYTKLQTFDLLIQISKVVEKDSTYSLEEEKQMFRIVNNVNEQVQSILQFNNLLIQKEFSIEKFCMN